MPQQVIDYFSINIKIFWNHLQSILKLYWVEFFLLSLRLVARHLTLPILARAGKRSNASSTDIRPSNLPLASKVPASRWQLLNLSLPRQPASRLPWRIPLTWAKGCVGVTAGRMASTGPKRKAAGPPRSVTPRANRQPDVRPLTFPYQRRTGKRFNASCTDINMLVRPRLWKAGASRWRRSRHRAAKVMESRCECSASVLYTPKTDIQLTLK